MSGVQGIAVISMKCPFCTRRFAVPDLPEGQALPEGTEPGTCRFFVLHEKPSCPTYEALSPVDFIMRCNAVLEGEGLS